MADRVLSTGTARTAIHDMRSIINGSLLDEIQRLGDRGQTLSQPDVWDGRLAAQFRNELWPSVMSSLRETQTKLEELRQQIDQINQNIMIAGGNE